MASKSKQPDERTPLLQFPGLTLDSMPTPLPSPSKVIKTNQHLQFCALVGMPPLTHPSIPPEALKDMPKPNANQLYQRLIRRRRAQGRVYAFTASLANTLLLSQVVLGAALTALGAAEQSHVLIALFGAMNTIIAGLVAYLKSRGQPMRARMYAEDLERLVDDVENSATMWLGIAAGVHGYDAIDTDDKVTVRAEVARLTRLWEAAVRRNVSNDPDMYASGAGAEGADNSGLRSARRGAPGPPLPLPPPPPAQSPPTTPAPPTPAAAPAAAPAAPAPPTTPAAAAAAAPTTPAPQPEVPAAPAHVHVHDDADPDESPATAIDTKKSGKKPQADTTKVEAPAAPEPVKEAEPAKDAAPPPAKEAESTPAPPDSKAPADAPASAADSSSGTTLVGRPSGESSQGSGSSSEKPSTPAAAQSAQRANESLKRTPSGAPPGSRAGSGEGDKS